MSGERLTNRMNKLFLSSNNRHSLQLETSKNKLTKTEATVNERTIQRRLNEARVKYNRPFIKAIAYRSASKKSFKMSSRQQSYELGRGDFFRRDNHSSKYSKTIGMELDRKKGRSFEPSDIRAR